MTDIPIESDSLHALKTRAKQIQGQECIYREKLLVVHARLEEIVFNTYGLRISLTDLESPGFYPIRDDWSVCCAWDYGVWRVRDSSWSSSPYLLWTVYFDQRLIAEIKYLAAKLVESKPMQRCRKLCSLIDRIG